MTSIKKGYEIGKIDVTTQSKLIINDDSGRLLKAETSTRRREILDAYSPNLPRVQGLIDAEDAVHPLQHPSSEHLNLTEMKVNNQILSIFAPRYNIIL